MNKLTMLVHGGAGPDSEYIKKNIEAYKQSLRDAADTGYRILEMGGSAVDAVEAAVNYLEDNELFNAGRGSALNEKAEVEMGASIADGKTLKGGGVAIVTNVKNPVTLARAIMEKSKHIFLGQVGALEFAQKQGLKIMPDAYFITDHAFSQYTEAMAEEANTLEDAGRYAVRKKEHGTVGAVAVDNEGNVAAATSTGGLENKIPGRISDSAIVGIGSYANNKTCAVSSTGDGEVLVQNVVCFHLSSLVRYKGMSIGEASDYLLNQELKDVEGDMGVIVADSAGNFAFEFNSERMHRAWKTSDGAQGAEVYR